MSVYDGKNKLKLLTFFSNNLWHFLHIEFLECTRWKLNACSHLGHFLPFFSLIIGPWIKGSRFWQKLTEESEVTSQIGNPKSTNILKNLIKYLLKTLLHSFFDHGYYLFKYFLNLSIIFSLQKKESAQDRIGYFFSYQLLILLEMGRE